MIFACRKVWYYFCIFRDSSLFLRFLLDQKLSNNFFRMPSIVSWNKGEGFHWSDFISAKSDFSKIFSTSYNICIWILQKNNRNDEMSKVIENMVQQTSPPQCDVSCLCTVHLLPTSKCFNQFEHTSLSWHWIFIKRIYAVKGS